VPQDRKRVIFVGYHVDLNKRFNFDSLIPEPHVPTLRETIGDLQESALPALANNKTNGEACLFPNHEYMTGGFSSMYMSRNRVRSWNEPSFTIQAGGRHAPIHPQASKMILVGKDRWIFDSNSIQPYQRLSIRECAIIQTFPDSFIFYYTHLAAAYKMIGNAVPVNLSYAIAQAIYKDLFSSKQYVRKNKMHNRSLESIDLELTLF
jgi:DNA (cytosine-5)-methyltransferase 1